MVKESSPESRFDREGDPERGSSGGTTPADLVLTHEEVRLCEHFSRNPGMSASNRTDALRLAHIAAKLGKAKREGGGRINIVVI